MKRIRSAVTCTPAAGSSEAAVHYGGLLQYETNCADVDHAVTTGNPDFILLDVRSPEFYELGHVAGARLLPHAGINTASLAEHPAETLFVVYCAGPHCNGTDKAALRLADHGRPVKKMIGGVTGWLDEGYSLDSAKT